MEKLSWKAPTLEDLDKIRLTAEINNQIGNEMSAVNLFLYQIKYDTKIFWASPCFRLRHLQISKSKRGKNPSGN